MKENIFKIFKQKKDLIWLSRSSTKLGSVDKYLPLSDICLRKLNKCSPILKWSYGLSKI